ncbi:hypothetical protein A2U01_0105556, partial [Trifolium medium]|nr:hypothetical protein [Trifolium medium]
MVKFWAAAPLALWCCALRPGLPCLRRFKPLPAAPCAGHCSHVDF